MSKKQNKQSDLTAWTEREAPTELWKGPSGLTYKLHALKAGTAMWVGTTMRNPKTTEAQFEAMVIKVVDQGREYPSAEQVPFDRIPPEDKLPMMTKITLMTGGSEVSALDPTVEDEITPTG